MNATLITPIVATLIRRGVSHVAWLFWSQVRTPAAPVAAAIADITHVRWRLALKLPTQAGTDPI